jgi:hypothetical protein
LKLPRWGETGMKMKFLVVMFLCFIIGGYLILNFISQMYNSWMRGSIIDNINITNRFGDFNGTPFFQRAPLDRPFSPQIYLDLVAGVMFIVAGVSIWHLIREKEFDILKEELAGIFLLPEEKAIVDELNRAGGEITQRELVNKTGLSKVKIHRVLSKLESKKIIRRYPYGMTKKIVIEKKQ